MKIRYYSWKGWERREEVKEKKKWGNDKARRRDLKSVVRGAYKNGGDEEKIL